MKPLTTLMHILYGLLIMICLPVAAQASFFGSDPLGSYKGAELEKDDMTPVISLLNINTKAALHKDRSKLKELIRKETVRLYLVKQAKKKLLSGNSDLALRMQVTADHELYRSYLASQYKLADQYPDQALLQQVYDKNKQQFTAPAQVHLRQIFLVVNKKKSLKKQKNEVRFMKAMIKSGKKRFADYAKSHSDHKQSAKNGGDMGWLSINALSPEIRTAVTSMSKKNNLQIVQSSGGLHLIELLDTRSPTVTPLAKIKQALIGKLRLQKQAEMEQAYITSMRKKNPISFKKVDLVKTVIASKKRSSFKSQAATVVASMGGVDLSLGEFMSKLHALEALQNNSVTSTDDSFVKQTLIGNLLFKKYIVSKARSSKWDKQADVKLRVSRAADDVLVQAMLVSMTKLPRSYPSTRELKAAYNANKQKFLQPDMIHIAQIYIATSKDGKQNKKLSTAMNDLHGLLDKHPESFAELAKKYSQHQASKANGGDMGWLKLASLLPAMKVATENLSTNAISPVIQSKQGWHILKLLERRPAGVTPFSEAKPVLAKALRTAEQNKRIQKEIASMVSSKSLSIDKDELKNLAGSL